MNDNSKNNNSNYNKFEKSFNNKNRFIDTEENRKKFYSK